MSKVSLISDIVTKDKVQSTSEKFSATKKTDRTARVMTSMIETGKFQRCEKKWFAAFFATVIIFLLTSSFSLTMFDGFMMKRGVDIFGNADHTNELIVNAVQFVAVFILLMWLLKHF